MYNSTISNDSESSLVAHLDYVRNQMRYCHLCIYFQGIVGALLGLIFLFRQGKSTARYSYPPTVRIWFICLSLTDVISLSGYCYRLFYSYRNRPNDMFTASVDMVTTVSDIFNVGMQLGVSIERILVLKWELRSRRWVSIGCVKRCLVVSLVFSVVDATGDVLTRWYTKGFSPLIWNSVNFMLLLICVSVMVGSSIFIMLLVRRKTEERSALLADGVKAMSIQEDLTPEVLVKTRRALELRREIDLALRLFVANVMFIVCYIPMFVLLLWRGVLTARRRPSPLIEMISRLFTPILRYNNSFNWIPIYLFNKSFRRHFNLCQSTRKIDL